MIEFVEDIKKEPASLWDKYTPIINSGNLTRAYIMNEIIEPFEYAELTDVLTNASNKEVIEIILNTPGGRLDSATMLVDTIRKSDAKVIAHLHGDVASAGTIIALACDDVKVTALTSFMIHYFSGGNAGKGNEIKAQNRFMEVHMPKIFHNVYKDFLTSEEIEEVINGKDFWMDGDEVLKRLNKNKVVKNAKSK